MRLAQYKRKDVKGKRVLLRADLDIKGKVDRWHDLRLERLTPVIKEIIDLGASQIVLIGHRGRPDNNDKSLSLRPVKRRLAELLKQAGVNEQIFFVADLNNSSNKHRAKKIIMLQNLRFWPGEKGREQRFARILSGWGDIYINNAFANSHRGDTSMTILPKIMPAAFAGPGVIEEVKELSQFFNKSSRPLVVILGGAKISEKLDLLKLVLRKADKVLVGGGLANNLLKASGVDVGRSLTDKIFLKGLSSILKNPKVVLPIDFIASEDDKHYQRYRKDQLNRRIFIGDLGPKTVLLFKKEIKKARTILWNGPLSKYEIRAFSKGMFALAKAVGASSAKTVAGGAETAEVIETLNLAKKFSYISVGGGAMLTFLTGGKMPALEALAGK